MSRLEPRSGSVENYRLVVTPATFKLLFSKYVLELGKMWAGTRFLIWTQFPYYANFFGRPKNGTFILKTSARCLIQSDRQIRNG